MVAQQAASEKIAAEVRDYLLECKSASDIAGDAAATRNVLTKAANKLNSICGEFRMQSQATDPLSDLRAIAKELLRDYLVNYRKHVVASQLRLAEAIVNLAKDVSGEKSLSSDVKQVLSVFFEPSAVEMILQRSANEYYLYELLSQCVSSQKEGRQQQEVIVQAIKRINRNRYANPDATDRVIRNLNRPFAELSEIEKIESVQYGWFLIELAPISSKTKCIEGRILPNPLYGD